VRHCDSFGGIEVPYGTQTISIQDIVQHLRGMNGSEAADTQAQFLQTLSLEKEAILEIVRHPEPGQIGCSLVSLPEHVSKL
jgi:hypothetical protein